MQCDYCDRWGKCTEWFWDLTRNRREDGFWDVDGIGVLCCACEERDYPPHAAYVQTLFLLPPATASIIAAFAYLLYANALAFREWYEGADDAAGSSTG